MSPDQERRLEEIFSAARDLPAQERAAFLERARGGDATLRQHRANHQVKTPDTKVEKSSQTPNPPAGDPKP